MGDSDRLTNCSVHGGRTPTNRRTVCCRFFDWTIPGIRGQFEAAETHKRKSRLFEWTTASTTTATAATTTTSSSSSASSSWFLVPAKRNNLVADVFLFSRITLDLDSLSVRLSPGALCKPLFHAISSTTHRHRRLRAPSRRQVFS